MSLDGRMETALDYVHAGKREVARATESGDEHERQACIKRAAMHFRHAAEELDPSNGRFVVVGTGRPL